jgi:hypothetical protein
MISPPNALSTSRSHVYTVLNQLCAIARRSTHPLGMRHVFPCHRIQKASALTLLRCCRRSSPSSVFIRLSSPTQPNVSTATMLHLAPHLPEHCRALLDAFWYMILSRRTHTSPSQNNLAAALVILPANSLARSLSKISKLSGKYFRANKWRLVQIAHLFFLNYLLSTLLDKLVQPASRKHTCVQRLVLALLLSVTNLSRVWLSKYICMHRTPTC